MPRDSTRFRVTQTEYPYGVALKATKRQAIKCALEMGGDVTVEDWGQTTPNAMNKWIIRHGTVLAAGRVAKESA